MKKYKIYLLAAAGMLSVLSACQKQGEEQPRQPESEMVNVKFNSFIKEGDNIRPMQMGTRAGEGTLDNGYYLYGHAHKLPFATSSGNTYVPIFEYMKIKTDGTYQVPRFWLDKKVYPYMSFQAYTATGATGMVLKTPTVATSGAPYVTTLFDVSGERGTTDILSAAAIDLQLNDEIPTVNLYFEHRLCRLAFKLQRMNSGGPDLFDVTMSINLNSTYSPYMNSSIPWVPTQAATGINTRPGGVLELGTTLNIPASQIAPVFVDDLIYGAQSISAGWGAVSMTYAIEPGGKTRKTLTTSLPALTLQAGKQLDIIIGYMVEADQIVIQGVTLADWTTNDYNVPEYK